jgi:hypothetical protein
MLAWIYTVFYCIAFCNVAAPQRRYETRNNFINLEMLNIVLYVRFEVFTAVVMKSIIFWDVTPCSLLSCKRRFGGTYRLHPQGRRNNFSKNQQVSRWCRLLTESPRLT